MNHRLSAFETFGYIVAMIWAAWSDLPLVLHVLALFMVLDVLSGVLVALVNHVVSSDQYLRGVVKKVHIIILVALAAKLEQLVGTPLMHVVAGFFLAGEGLSILENARRMGVPVPAFLQEALRRISAPESAPEHQPQRRRGRSQEPPS